MGRKTRTFDDHITFFPFEISQDRIDPCRNVWNEDTLVRVSADKLRQERTRLPPQWDKIYPVEFVGIGLNTFRQCLGSLLNGTGD